MRWCKKDGQGECVSLLKRLMGGGRRVKVETRDGLMFIDEVMRVAESDGPGTVVFSSRRLELGDIERVEALT